MNPASRDHLPWYPDQAAFLFASRQVNRPNVQRPHLLLADAISESAGKTGRSNDSVWRKDGYTMLISTTRKVRPYVVPGALGVIGVHLVNTALFPMDVDIVEHLIVFLAATTLAGSAINVYGSLSQAGRGALALVFASRHPQPFVGAPPGLQVPRPDRSLA